MVTERMVGAALLVWTGFAVVGCDAKTEAPAPVAPVPVASVVPSAAVPTAAVEASVAAPTPSASASASAVTSAVATAASSGSPPLDTRCAGDEDCVPAPGCCPVPCTEHVINRKDLSRANEQNAKSCPPVRNCISAGGCRTHAYLCVRKSCKLVYSDSPDYRSK